MPIIRALIILLLSVSLSHAGMLQGIVSGQSAAAGDGCGTNGLLFSWHMENVDVTLGTPAGCSVGDTTATLTGTGTAISATQAEDGTNSLYCPGPSKKASFTISTEDIAKHAAGTIDVWVYVTTESDTDIIKAYSDGNNAIYLETKTFSTIAQFQITHYAGGSYRSATTTYGTSFPLNQWIHVIAEWDYTAHGSNHLQITADGANTGVSTIALGTWGGTLTTLTVGDSSGNSQSLYIDKIKIYGTWQ